MALTPAQNEALLREIDDAVREDDLRNFWVRYGRWLIALVVAGLVLFGGWLWWQNHRQEQAEAASERYAAMLAGVGANGAGKADASALAALDKAPQPGFRAGSLMTKAGLASASGDTKGAIAGYGAIAADDSLPQPYRDLAVVRQTALEFDSLKPQAVIDRMRPFTQADSPWYGSAGELTALAYMKLGKPDRAGSLFAAIAKADGVPRTVQTRAVQMASLLGVDAEIAPRPGETPQSQEPEDTKDTVANGN